MKKKHTESDFTCKFCGECWKCCAKDPCEGALKEAKSAETLEIKSN